MRGSTLPYTRHDFDGARSPGKGLFVGSPQEVADKTLLLRKRPGIDRFLMQMPIATMRHDIVNEAIRVYTTQVVLLFQEAIEKED